MSIRVRLSFDELVPGYSKKTWFLFDTASCRLVADLEHLIQKKFVLQRNSCINLYIEGFLLPTQEKIELVRDGDIIRVEQQSNFCKDKKIAKCDDDKDTSSSKAAKKQKLDCESHTSVNGQDKKKKSNPIKNAKNKGKSEKKPINKDDSSGKGLQSNQFVKVGKPCQSNDMAAVQKGKNISGSKNTTVMKNRTVSSSSESSTQSSTSEDEITGKLSKIYMVQRGQNRGKPAVTLPSTTTSSSEDEILAKGTKIAKRTKYGSFSKHKEGNASVNSSSTSSSSSTLTSSISDWTSSSSSEDSCVNACDKNTKSADKRKSSSSLSSSSSLLSSSSSSEDLSDDKQKQGLNSKTKNKYLNKTNKTKTKIHPATTASAKKQNQNLKNLSKTASQSKNDGLNSKIKEKVMGKYAKSKATSGISGKEKVATVNLINKQINIQEKETQLTNGNSFPTRGIIRSKITHIQPPIINSRHIRFDSEEDIPACQGQENIDSSTSQNHGNNPYDAGADGNNNPNTSMTQENSVIPLHNGEVDRNGSGRMNKSMRHAIPTKKTAVDYSALLSLCGPPRVGDRIAYKVLELSASYTPEMSDYKEGTVFGYDPVKNEVLIELTHDSLTKPLGDGNISTKFELIYGDGDEDEDEESNGSRPPVVLDRKVSVPWTSMVDPRLIISS